ncbi:hypothetical protein DUNSADRAFT_12679 [Dunaliella salina]|uniref:Uncharacterized protein n=1 Tax=Dunaliella salina TaxID=3046 RepID=A0ABQ7GAV1_DUNSA|nr:hypothetical protein DUNSADRAFT_12679 [Dunaliella salina]|eukprot:KAF5831732.1 hypothetical protein DUNSADRAFT_12679 [Dunaliella salina]
MQQGQALYPLRKRRHILVCRAASSLHQPLTSPKQWPDYSSNQSLQSHSCSSDSPPLRSILMQSQPLAFLGIHSHAIPITCSGLLCLWCYGHALWSHSRIVEPFTYSCIHACNLYHWLWLTPCGATQASWYHSRNAAPFMHSLMQSVSLAVPLSSLWCYSLPVVLFMPCSAIYTSSLCSSAIYTQCIVMP